MKTKQELQDYILSLHQGGLSETDIHHLISQDKDISKELIESMADDEPIQPVVAPVVARTSGPIAPVKATRHKREAVGSEVVERYAKKIDKAMVEALLGGPKSPTAPGVDSGNSSLGKKKPAKDGMSKTTNLQNRIKNNTFSTQ